MEAARHPWPALGALLVRDDMVDKDELDAVLAEQGGPGPNRMSGKRLGEILVDRGIVTSEQVAERVAEQYELPFVALEESEINLQAAALLPADVARRVSALPISVLPDDSLLVAVADPTNVLRSDELRRTLRRPLRFAVAAREALENAIAFADQRVSELATRGTDDSEIGDVVVEAPDEELVVLPSAETLDPPSADLERTAVHAPALGTLLIRDGLVSEEEVDAALAQQRISGSKRLGEILVERGSVTRAQVARLVAEQYDLPFLELSDSDVEPKAAALLSEELARRYSALPICFLSDDSVLVVVADPTNTLATDELRLSLDVPVRFAVAAPSDLEAALAAVHGPPVAAAEGTADTELDEREPEAVEQPEWSQIDDVIQHALSLGATDIHFTPQSHASVVRARIDGVMRELETLSAPHHLVVAERLKTLGHLETEDRRSPQDGRIAFSVGESTVDLRIVVMPTKHGEKVTLHQLHHASAPGSLADLGMTSDSEDAFRRAILRRSGAVLVCGPAESGKTTTLYAALQELNTPEYTLLTIEDRVEHLIPGVDQTEVDAGAGLTLASGLHAILKSDPDVILVGEIDDEVTAQTAMRAALAGRLVLSSLYAESAVSAVRRLEDLGVGAGLVGATLTCVVAQCLVRRICTDCRESYYAAAADLAELERVPEEAGRRLLARGTGCEACGGTGYRGRVAIFETLTVTEEIRELVTQRAATAEIQRAAIADGMRPLREDGIRLCLDGVTTAAELRRVLRDPFLPDATSVPAARTAEPDAGAEIAPA